MLYDMGKCSPCYVKLLKRTHNFIYCVTAILFNMCTFNEKRMGKNICYSQHQDSRLFLLFIFDTFFCNFKSPTFVIRKHKQT